MRGAGSPVEADAEPLGFDAVYRGWFDRVVRWLPAMGVARAEVEDVAQDVFMTVQRRLPSFDGENLGGWLYAIALRTALNHRRLAWVRRVFFAPSEPTLVAPSTPEADLARAQLLEQADAILKTLPDKQRRAFVLFEVEGYSGEEIAALEGIPLATVWTRVHHARKAFTAGAAALRQKDHGR